MKPSEAMESRISRQVKKSVMYHKVENAASIQLQN